MTSLSQLSDAELLARYTGEHLDAVPPDVDEQTDEAKRHEAFRLLVLRHGRIVMSACRGVLRSEADAEDAFQATFFVLARKAADIERRASLAAWLHRVAMRISIRASKRKQQRQMQSLTVVAEPSSGELQLVSTQASLLAVHEAIAQLPERLRAAVLLTYFEELTRAETAERLGVTPGVIQARLKKARGQLRRRLALRGTTLAALAILAQQASSSIAGGSLLRLSDACAQTVLHVQSGLAAKVNSGSAGVPQTLAQGVIRSMNITATLRHAFVIVVSLACAWAAFGASSSQGNGAVGGQTGPFTLAANTHDGDHSASAMFVSAGNLPDGSQDNHTDDQDQAGKQDKKAQPGESAWGEEVKGLQAAVRLKNKEHAGPFEIGKTVEIEFVIRNVSDAPIEFESAEWREDDQIFVKDSDGKAVTKISSIWYSGYPRIKRHKLAPGEEVAIDSGPIGVGDNTPSDSFKHPVVYVPTFTPGKFSVRFQLPMPDVGTNGDQGWKGTLTTGDLELEIKQATAGKNFAK